MKRAPEFGIFLAATCLAAISGSFMTAHAFYKVGNDLHLAPASGKYGYAVLDITLVGGFAAANLVFSVWTLWRLAHGEGQRPATFRGALTIAGCALSVVVFPIAIVIFLCLMAAIEWRHPGDWMFTCYMPTGIFAEILYASAAACAMRRRRPGPPARVAPDRPRMPGS